MTVTNPRQVGGSAANDEETMDDSFQDGYLSRLGAYGFGAQEPVILAALVTGDPLLLVGKSGTGKTFLLNSISEALGLEHRHYNASLISFDDLVGFPYPDDAKASVRFLETPATVWGAQSVLIDEISRCKPEHQNRLFSLIHERRVQGLPLTSLRYRWAAMNPCSSDQSAGEAYLGSEPLDPALADRFALIVPVGDWDTLNEDDRRRVANPAGEGARADDGGRLAAALTEWQAGFQRALEACPANVIEYVTGATTALRTAGIRVSPRRTRLLTRSLLAALTVTQGDATQPLARHGKALFLEVLNSTLPQATWGETVNPETVRAAHELAWCGAMLEGPAQWLHRLHLEPTLDGKARLLLASCPDADTGSLAVEQLLANEPQARAAAFALAAFPAATGRQLPIGAEGINDLGRVAQPLLTVSGEVSWQERLRESGTSHPELATYGQVMARLKDARRKRAEQLFFYCAIHRLPLADPKAFEAEFNRCVRVFAARVAA
jgi:MoxR-like ATPase